MTKLKMDTLQLAGIGLTTALLGAGVLYWVDSVPHDFYDTLFMFLPAITSATIFLTLWYVRKHLPKKVKKIAIMYTVTVAVALTLTAILAYFDSRDCRPYIILGCLTYGQTLLLLSLFAIPFLAIVVALQSVSIVIGIKVGKYYKRNSDKEEK